MLYVSTSISWLRRSHLWDLYSPSEVRKSSSQFTHSKKKKEKKTFTRELRHIEIFRQWTCRPTISSNQIFPSHYSILSLRYRSHFFAVFITIYLLRRLNSKESHRVLWRQLGTLMGGVYSLFSKFRPAAPITLQYKFKMLVILHHFKAS